MNLVPSIDTEVIPLILSNNGPEKSDNRAVRPYTTSSYLADGNNMLYTRWNKVTDPKYQPCISVENEFSMCCRLNDTGPDQCLQNGLCYWTSRNEYWRDYCTDKTWDSPNCLSNTTCDSAVSNQHSK